MRAIKLAIPICLGLTAPALADPPTPVSEVVVTATRLPEILVDAPDAYVVDRTEIDQLQASFAADVLRLIPGLAVSDDGAFGGVTSVSIRGASSDKTLVLIDGVVQNDPSQPAGGYDFGALDLSDIERVEVLSGPQGSLWGSDAIGGVISLTTREENGLRAAVEGGSLDTVEGSVGAGISHDRWALGFDASGYRSNGVSKADGFPGDDPFYEWTAGLSGRITLGPVLSVDGRVRYENSHTDIAGYPPPNYTFADDSEYATSKSWSGFLRARLPGPWGFANTLLLNGYDIDRASLGGLYPSGYQAQRGDIRWTAEKGSPTDPFGVAFGVERDATRATLSDGSDRSLGDTSAFLVGHARPVHPLSVTASVRYDAPDSFAGRATARAGGVYDLGAGLSITGDWGQGFKTPTISQIACDFCYPPGPSVGLKPEVAQGWDAGLRETLANGRFEASVDYFRLAVRDEINYGIGRYVNIDNALSSGVEANGSARLTRSLTLRAEYSHTDAIDVATGASLPRVPRDAGSVSLLWTSGRLNGSITVRSESSQADVDPNTFEPALRAGYALADIAAGYRLTSHIEVTARVTNLADSHYEEVLGYGEPRRMILLGVRWRQ